MTNSVSFTARDGATISYTPTKRGPVKVHVKSLLGVFVSLTRTDAEEAMTHWQKNFPKGVV